MKKKVIVRIIFGLLLVVAAYFAGFKLGEGQAHQRISDAWNKVFGQNSEAVAAELLTDEIQGAYYEDPFDVINAIDPFADDPGPFLGGNALNDDNGF